MVVNIEKIISALSIKRFSQLISFKFYSLLLVPGLAEVRIFSLHWMPSIRQALESIESNTMHKLFKQTGGANLHWHVLSRMQNYFDFCMFFI